MLEFLRKNINIKGFSYFDLLMYFILIGMAISVYYHYFLNINGFNANNSFLFRPDDRLMDFFNYMNQCKELNPYMSVGPTPTRPYFPFGYLIGYIFTLIHYKAAYTLLFCGSACLTALYMSTVSEILHNKIFFIKWLILIIFSYPFVFNLDRGNPEILLFCMLMLFLYHYFYGNKIIALILISSAIAMKLTPAIFLLLFVTDKRYKDIIYIIIVTIFLTIISLSVFTWNSSINYTIFDNFARMIENQKLFNLAYSKDAEGIYFSHSIFGLIKLFIFNKFEIFAAKKIIANLFVIYLGVVLVFFSYVIYQFIYLKNELWVKIAMLITCMLLFPHMSGDYKLLHVMLIMPFLLAGENSIEKNIALVFCALLLIPKGFWHNTVLPEANLGVVLNPVILLNLFILCCWSNFKTKKVEQIVNVMD